jgi:hypothetical protein
MDDGLPYSGSVTGSWDQFGNYCGQSNVGLGPGLGTNLYVTSDLVSNNWVTGYSGCALYIQADF